MRIFGRMPQSLTETPGDRSVHGPFSPADPPAMSIEIRSVAGLSAGAILRTEPRHVKAPYINERKKYDLIIAASGQVVYDCDLTTGDIVWSGSLERVLGYEREEMGGIEEWAEMVHPEDRAEALRLLEVVDACRKLFRDRISSSSEGARVLGDGRGDARILAVEVPEQGQDRVGLQIFESDPDLIQVLPFFGLEPFDFAIEGDGLVRFGQIYPDPDGGSDGKAFRGDDPRPARGDIKGVRWGPRPLVHVQGGPDEDFVPFDEPASSASVHHRALPW